MKINKRIMCLIMVVLTMISFVGCQDKNPVDKPSTDDKTNVGKEKVRVFSVPEEFPQFKVVFDVEVDSKPMGIYSDRNGWNKPVNFGLFELREGATAEVSITPSFEFETYKILPDNLGVESTRKGNTITYKVSDTTAKLSFVFDNDYKGSTLNLFTYPFDDNAPTESSDNVIYFGPGYHKLYETDARKLSLQSGYTIYLAGGAVLEGCAVGDSVENVTVTGSGMMLSYHPDSDWPADKHGRCVSLKKCENITIKNIMSHVHRVKDWTTVVKDSENIVFENYKVVSPRWASTDAMDIVNSSDVTIKNSFLRSTDDTITLKGMAGIPENGLPVENITVEHTQLWSEANSSMVVGEEARAEYYKNIRFSDIDVLFSYDDKVHHGKLNERSVMSIVLLNGTYIEDIVWENIRVNECERLVCFKFTDTFYMGSNVGDQTSPGYVKNVTIKNVTSNSTSDSEIANEILIQGWDENKTISNVNFENVVIKGKKLLPADMENFVLNDYVSDITIDAPVPDTFEPTVLNEYSFGYKDKNSFSEKGMQNFFPVFSGTSNMPDDFPIFDMIGSDKDPVSVSDEWGEYAQWHNSTYEWAYVRSSGFIQPQKNTTAGVVWVAPKDGKYDINNIEINFNIASGATVSTMYYSVYYGNIATKEATRLFSYNNNSAESNEFLHRINLKKGDRLYFIMDLADNSLNNAKPRIRLTIKHVADTPDVPVATNQTATTITLNATDGYEYGYIADDGTSITYSDSNVIENLEVGKTYKIYQRAKATEAALASDDSAVLEYAMSKPGDIDRNNEIGATDLTILRKYLLNSPIEGNYFEGLMNANSVGEVDICDLVAIKKMSSQVS